jgi:hypothetical protein
MTRLRRRHWWHGPNELELHLTWAEVDALQTVLGSAVGAADDQDLEAMALFRGQQRMAARRVTGIIRRAVATRSAEVLARQRQ